MRKSNDNVNHSGKPSDGGGLEGELLDLVHTVMHQYRSQQYQVLRDGPHDITHMESKVLGYVGQHPGATQSEMALHSGRDKAQLARLVKGLRERGLLSAQADAADRRSVSLSLTPPGQAVLRSLRQQSRHLNAKAVAGLSEPQRRQLLSLLQQVRANLDAP